MQADFELAVALIAEALGDSRIARLTGIPRSTVSAWRHGRGDTYHRRLATANSRWRPPCAASYAYLLGIYLGDGCLNVGRAVPRACSCRWMPPTRVSSQRPSEPSALCCPTRR
jgi:hypothetical protein